MRIKKVKRLFHYRINVRINRNNKMKKLLSILAMTALVGACSSPPEATPFPHESKETNADTFLERDVIKNVPLNRLDKATWRYSLYQYPNTVSQQEWAKFWYLAQHATHIEVQGERNDLQALKYNLKANGVAAEINLVEICVSTKRNPCPKYVNLTFERKAPKQGETNEK